MGKNLDVSLVRSSFSIESLKNRDFDSIGASPRRLPLRVSFLY